MKLDELSEAKEHLNKIRRYLFEIELDRSLTLVQICDRAFEAQLEAVKALIALLHVPHDESSPRLGHDEIDRDLKAMWAPHAFEGPGCS